MRKALSALAVVTGVALAGVDPAWGQQERQEIPLGYLRHDPGTITISLTEMPPDNLGTAGAELGVADNNTTGRFTGQDYTLDARVIEDANAAVETARAMVEDGASFLIADLPAEALLEVADALAEEGVPLFNAGAPDDRLRNEDCRANTIHVAPSRAMLADALAQYLAWKRWNRWLLAYGSHKADGLMAEALRRAAERFGAEVVEERLYEDTGGARRTDSGHVQVQAQLPVFFQDAPDHDVVAVADETEVFGPYVPYRTWEPRPVVGTQGLVPMTWSPDHVQWGALQLQSRFVELAGRPMVASDMHAWMAARTVGEAATRTNSAEPAAIMDYILSDAFELAAFKGQALTLRPWNLQLRQPILLDDGHTVVSVSPQEGFLHQRTPLDTLGFDEPESACSLG